jgi:hypothetical protein
MSGISATFPNPGVGEDLPHHLSKGAEMILAFFLLTALAGIFGWTTDSRDSADWKPTNDGTRAGRSY